jgi:hypothetical protein
MSPAGVKQPPGSESAATIRDRGALGAVLLTARQATAQVVAFIGMLVLAHLLTPTTLAMVALGTTIVTVGTFFADGGLGAALLRKTEDRTVDELRTLLAMQLVLACAIAVGVAVVGSQTGTVGTVTAIMACSLPLLALRAPHAIALERALDYRPIAATEFAESSWMLVPWAEAALFSRALWRAGVVVSRLILAPVAVAVASALLAHAVQSALASRLIPGIETAAVVLAAYLALSLVFNLGDLLATARRVRSLT